MTLDVILKLEKSKKGKTIKQTLKFDIGCNFLPDTLILAIFFLEFVV